MSKKVGITAIIGVFAILIAAVIFILPDNKTYTNMAFAMDTFIDINIKGKESESTGKRIVDEISFFENHASMFVENSDVSAINANAGKSYVPVNKAVYDLIKRATELCEQSGGKFDITIGPLVQIWDISGDNPKVPQIDAQLLSLINYKHILFDDTNCSVMLKNPGQQIDLGGIAKGNISDKIYTILQDSDIKEASISVGGNVIVYGDRSYKVGIKHPRQTDSLIATVTLSNSIISTTGDYERYFEANGIRYHHILDPKSGQPYNGDFYSVTVIGSDGTLNDYLSTALFMTPKQELIGLLDKYSIVAIGKDNVVYASENLEIELKDKSFTLYK